MITKKAISFILLCFVFFLVTIEGVHYPRLVIYDDKNLNRSRRLTGSSVEALSHVSQWTNLPISEEASNAGGYVSSQCEPVTVPICKDIFYQYTRMPNMFNHETQEEAGLEAHQFYPLIHINCSKDLHFLICSIYTPICMAGFSHSLPPCRSVCERAKAGCMPIMSYYAFSWPKRMNCDQFPVLNNPDGILCMDRDLTDTEKVTEPTNSRFLSNEQMTGRLRTAAENSGIQDTNTAALKISDVDLTCSCSCRNSLVPLLVENNSHLSQVNVNLFPGCALPCHSIHFKTEADRRFVKFWLGLWSVLCLISTTATVLTFLTNPSRFQYPGQPVIYISVCYFFVSIGYILRVIMGHEAIACTEVTTSLRAAMGMSDATPTNFLFGENKQTQILQFSLSGQAGCATVFLLTYFFGMASCVWWVVLTITWFLAAGMKWSSEAISKYTQIFHFIAWVLPGVQTGTVLMLRAVDGDPVGGLCSVGATSDTNLTFFMLLPLVTYFIVGTFFLLAGFIALCKIRNVIKVQGRMVGGGERTEKLEKLMIKLGIFGVLYTVPAIVVIACIVYELRQRLNWQLGVACACEWSQKKQVPVTKRVTEMPAWSPPVPEYAIFMLKYFMSLIVGITSGFWIWSEKTIASWKRLCTRCGSRDSAINLSHLQNGQKPKFAWQPIGGVNSTQRVGIQSPSQFSLKTPQLPSSSSQHSNLLTQTPSVPTATFYNMSAPNNYFDADPKSYTQISDAQKPLGMPTAGLTTSGSAGLTNIARGSSSGIGSGSVISNYACPNSTNLSQASSGKSMVSEYERQKAMLPKHPNFAAAAYQPSPTFSYAITTSMGPSQQFDASPFGGPNRSVF